MGYSNTNIDTSPLRTKQGRDPSYDIARGIAIYLIAIAHVLRTGMVLSTIGVSVLSVFVFISGRNAACSSAFHLPLLSLLKKKFSSLLPSYFFCAGLSVVVFLALGRFAGSASDFSLPKGLFQILYANSKHDGMKWNTALWFLPCLFMLFLLAGWMLQVHPFPRLWVILTLLLFFLTPNCFSHLRLPWQIESALHLLPMFLLGLLFEGSGLQRNFHSLKKRSFLSFLLSLLFLSTYLFLAHLNGEVSIRTDEYHNPFLYLPATICGCAGILLLSQTIAGQKKKALPFDTKTLLTSFGKESMTILLWHKFPIIAMQLLLKYRLPVLSSHPDSLPSVLLSLPLAFLSVILALGWGRLLRKGSLFLITGSPQAYFKRK